MDYFHGSDAAFLATMGVDPRLLPDRETWLERLLPDLSRANARKQTFYLGWILDGKMIGHSNTNKIAFGKEACIHLHLWEPQYRKTGLGTELFKRSADIFIERFRLKRLVCEPRAENLAPNRVLKKIGFRFVKRYRTTPGLINYEQVVNRYVLDRSLGNTQRAPI